MGFKESELGKIPENWEVKLLSEVTKIQNGYAFKSVYFTDKGNPVIKIKNVNGRLVDLKDYQLYPYEMCGDLDRFIINNNDVLIAMTGAGSVGRIAKFVSQDDTKYYLNQRVGKIQSLENKLDNEFLYQVISTTKYEKILFDLANGSGQPNLSPDLIGLVKIPYPPLQEQKAIAHILSTFDEKIEVNNRINKTLEAMAQEIFKRWFVDFELPNENGDPYKSSGGEMMESKMGMIPKGWGVVEIGSIIPVKDGTHASPKAVPYGYPLITSKHLMSTKLDLNNANKISKVDYEEVNKRSKVDRFDILITMIGTVGNLYLVQDEIINFAIKNIGLFKTSENLEIYEYIYCSLKTDFMKQYISERMAGSTQQYISLGELRKIPICLPMNLSLDIIERFKKLVNPLLNKVYINTVETENLIAIRDTLLPKLMSGEIRVPIADKEIQ